jgi:hypothetical protein
MRTLLHLCKYLTRTACNAHGKPLPAALAPLLVKDLYEWIEGGRPADVFARHAAALPKPEAHAIELAFATLDRLEARVRAHEPEAMSAACETALRIAALITEPS